LAIVRPHRYVTRVVQTQNEKQKDKVFRESGLLSVTKEAVGTVALPTHSLFDDGIPRRLLLLHARSLCSESATSPQIPQARI
jgi:hypothetical protein